MATKPYSEQDYDRYFTERAKRDLLDQRYRAEKYRRQAEVGERAKFEAATSRLSALIVIQVLMLVVIVGEAYATHWYARDANESAGMDVLVLVSMLGSLVVFPWLLIEVLRCLVLPAQFKSRFGHAMQAKPGVVSTRSKTKARFNRILGGIGIAIMLLIAALVIYVANFAN